MLRLVLFCVAIAALAFPLTWLADRPGTILINWQGYAVETNVFNAVCILALVIGLSILTWSILVQLWRSPASIGALFNRRRQMRGLEALSAGMIAIGAGDRAMATRYAVQARKALPNEPLTHLLRAQAAQLSGDVRTSRRIYESMLGSTETEQLGLRGLFLEAQQDGEEEAARQFAERALRLNPRLSWPVDALFELQCKEHDWDGALETLATARKHQHFEKSEIDRRRAVLLTARAQALEETQPDRAMQLALEAHHLAHDLIPAAAIAGRILAGKGNTKRAARVLERTWRLAPHPDLATAYAHARVGDSPLDRLARVKRLAQINQHSVESSIAVATAALEARDFDLARRALQPLPDDQRTQRICTLMARIEGEELGDKGRVREWLARAVHAPRDPAWTADGIVADTWAPISPVTGQLDAFRWRVPVEARDQSQAEALTQKLDELVKLSTASQTAIDVDADAHSRSVHAAAGNTQRSAGARANSSDAEIVPQTHDERPAATGTVRTAASADADVDTRSGTAPSAPAVTAKPVEAAPRKAGDSDASRPAAAARTTSVTPGQDSLKAGDDATGRDARKATAPAATGSPATASPATTTIGAPVAAATQTAGQVAPAASPAKVTAAERITIAETATAAAKPTAAIPSPGTETTASQTTGVQEQASRAATTAATGPAAPQAPRRGADEAAVIIAQRAPDDPGVKGESAGAGPSLSREASSRMRAG